MPQWNQNFNQFYPEKIVLVVSYIKQQTIQNRWSFLLTKLDFFLDDWVSTPTECLALAILLNQFPRNIYRNKPEMWSGIV